MSLQLLSLEIIDQIIDDCAEDSILTLAALRATNRCFAQRSITILFRGAVINGHAKSASSHTPIKFLLFFIANQHLCHIPKRLVFYGGEFDVDQVDAILRLLPNVTNFTLDNCSLTSVPIVAGIWPQIQSASIIHCSVSNKGLRNLLQTVVGLHEIDMIACSFWGFAEPVPFPTTTSELRLNLDGDMGEALPFVKAWAEHPPPLRRFSFLCRTDDVIEELAPWITKCAPTLEEIVIATRECCRPFLSALRR